MAYLQKLGGVMCVCVVGMEREEQERRWGGVYFFGRIEFLGMHARNGYLVLQSVKTVVQCAQTQCWI